jgi:hypothetical protein
MLRNRAYLAVVIVSSALAVAACGSDDTTSGGGTTSGSGGTGATGPGPGPGPGGNGGTGGTGGTGGAGAAGGMGGMGGGPPLPTGWVGDTPDLNNDAECLVWDGVSPAANENGHLYAVRLTPPSYPYTVTEVVYEMFHDGGRNCDSSRAHRVEVFVGNAATPDNNPTNPAMIDVPAVNIGNGTRVVTETLPSPLTLQMGEHLFVGVEMIAGDVDDGPTCLATCGGATVTDRDWWSNAAAAPYNWATLSSFGIDNHARIGANGM